MAKILSQEEIDALLSTVASGETETPKAADAAALVPDSRAITYDFKHPNRVSKDQLRKLENIHDKFGGHLGSALSTIQRAVIDIDLVSVDQITYTEFITSLVSPSCTYTFRMPPLEGLCIMDFNTSLAFAIVDRLFGGRGATFETERELTGIERNVMRKIAGRVFEQLEQGWERILEAKVEVVGFETNPQFIQIVPPGETVIVVSLQLNMPSASGMITICYPYVALEKILDRLSMQNWMDPGARGMESHERVRIEKLIRRVDVQLDARFAETQMSMQDLLELEAGMIIPLEAKVGDLVRIRVEGKAKYLGTVGNLGRRRAIRIDSPIPNEDE
jgi:flagellar motor switch protein FliM